ncbi:MAG: hypothetical protein ACC645_27530 [Pirellulales bacterium]
MQLFPAQLVVCLLLVAPIAQAAKPPATESADNAKAARRSTIYHRLSETFLATFDADRQSLAKKVRTPKVPYPLVRGTFHMHSHLSHDSRGTIAEIVQAARATGTRIVGFTEHPSRQVDVIRENVAGWHDGIYFLAGTENRGELFWPGRGGQHDLRLVAHPEERPTFDRSPYDGMEIYNTHSDAKDEPTSRLMTAMMMNLLAVSAHGEAAFCSFLDYPSDFLQRFDALTQAAPFAGIAANDSHQNQGIRLVALPGGGVEVTDMLGERIWKGEGLTAAGLRKAFGAEAEGKEKKVLIEVQLDPYEISMRHVGTFLQIDQINEKTVRQAIRGGRVVLGFEIIAPLPAFGFWVEQDGKPVGTIGDRLVATENSVLKVVLPLPAEIRVVRNGETFAEARAADTLDCPTLPPGVYRVEAFQRLAGERYPWVITNPIYVDRP